MCEILIRARDKVNVDDVYLDVKCLKRSDVVAVVPDGWAWSQLELTAPYWRIVKLPQVSVNAASVLLTPEVLQSPEASEKMLRSRGAKWDLDSATWSTPVRNWINDDSRATPFRSVNINEADFLSLVVQKTPLPDPNVLG
jgi:hypothetical protein